MTVHVSIPLEDDQIARIDEIAAARSESPAKVLAEAVANYLDYDAWFVGEVRRGLGSVERGDLRDFDDVARDLRARMKADQTPR